MPFGTAALVTGGIGALTSGLSAFGRQNPQFDPNNTLGRLQMAPQSALGLTGQNAAQGALGTLQGLNNSAAFGANSDLASMLQAYSQGGSMPTTQDTANAQAFAQSQFDPQRVAMQQAFSSQLTDANRQAALSGRGINDPILRAKLAQEQTRQSAQLTAQQGAFATQYAMNQPLQRLQFAEGRANVLTQDLQNRTNLANTIFSSGLQAQQQDYNQRASNFQNELSRLNTIANGQFLQQANSRSFMQNLGSTISGGIAGLGSGMSIDGTSLSSLFGGSGAPRLGSATFGQSAFSSPSVFGSGGMMNYFADNPYTSPAASKSYSSLSPMQEAVSSAGLRY